MLNNNIDIFILLILATAFAWGAYKGAIKQIASLCGIIFGIVTARIYYQVLAAKITPIIALSPEIMPVFSFTLILVGVLVVCIVIGRCVEELFSSAGIGFVNRIAGALLSLCKWVLILSLCMNLCSVFDVFNGETLKEQRKESQLYPVIQSIGLRLFPYIEDVVKRGGKLMFD